MVSQEAHIQRIWPVLKNESQIQVAAALKKMLSQLANAHAAVNVRLPKSFAKIAQCL